MRWTWQNVLWLLFLIWGIGAIIVLTAGLLFDNGLLN